MQVEMSDRGQFPTEHASRYLQQLCKHFAHKIEVQFDKTSGTAQFPFGSAKLMATPEQLDVVLTAVNEEGLDRSRRAIDSHLGTFAFREGYTQMNWVSLLD